MRQSPLGQHPHARAVSVRDLVGIANAIQAEAVRRYGQLASLMERRGEHETAEAFRRMRQEEQAHAGSIARWATRSGETVPPVEEFTWQLPPEIAASWSEVASSALLTPYRAFAIAVRNEERAFALYSYLAAHAVDEKVAALAERLAGEELEHAALLRRWRRHAYHLETGARRRPINISTLAELDALLMQWEAGIAGCHRQLAGRLRQLGDDASAALLLGLADDPARPSDAAIACHDSDCRDDVPLRLLIAAQKPLERLSEELEWVLDQADGELAAAAEAALVNVLRRLGRLSAQIQRLSELPRKPDGRAETTIRMPNR